MIGELGRSKAWAIAAIAAAVTWINAPSSQAGQCRLQSPAHRVSVLELYTSEGCDSCPPADRWFSALPQQGISLQTAVLLAFHVDYWNQLGWPDRFSQARFSQRQREVATRASRGVIYTPQLVLEGRDLRQDYSIEQLRSTLGAINREQGQAKIQAELSSSADVLRIIAEIEILVAPSGQRVQIWIAAFENGIHSRVIAGENAGMLLQHDYVVRELAGPFSIGPDGRARLEHQIKLHRDWDAQHLDVAIFVERADSGEILEAAAMYPVCAS